MCMYEKLKNHEAAKSPVCENRQQLVQQKA